MDYTNLLLFGAVVFGVVVAVIVTMLEIRHKHASKKESAVPEHRKRKALRVRDRS